MKTEFYQIHDIPAVLYGEPCERGYLFLHGQSGNKEEAGAFAEIAVPAGYQVLAIDLPRHGARKAMPSGFDPWTVVPELQAVMEHIKSRWSEISLRANSIGAHFSMLAFASADIHKALFASPVVNMERLIADMMGRAGITEQELRKKGEIATDFGQTLSWRYLTWEREHPIQNWRCPTSILYAGQDNMTSRETVEQFVAAHGASLTVMEHGEHWFHTPEQTAFLQAWERTEIED